MTKTDLYTIHCTVCGNIETDKDNNELYFYISDNWRDQIEKCSHCGTPNQGQDFDETGEETLFSFRHEVEKNGKETT